MRRVLGTWLPIALFAVFLLFPFYWMVLTALKPNDELVSSSANPFSVARVGFRGADVVGVLIYMAYLIPPAILFIPLAEIMLRLGWFDHLWALVPIYSTFLVPFCTWLLIGYLRNIPREIEEAAMVDGAGRHAP